MMLYINKDVWTSEENIVRITYNVGQTLRQATFCIVQITLPGIRFQSVSVVSLQDGESFEGTPLAGLPKIYLASIGNFPPSIIFLQNVVTPLYPIFVLCFVSQKLINPAVFKMSKSLLGQQLFKHSTVCVQRMLQLKHLRTLTRPSG